ncbi:hypothetical protein K5V21_11245 [Clostridium sardiniense]|uniref:Uncharacterized protein n=1 Tax=Clostridium sardiniense TaxID=29369 RepID=A0ABS7KZK1_CLOSR|nr:hypothetical protein [Clostridium sardiniense]MBY0756022.1 hypothetical protein [Clostridium sardiniense]
MDVSAKAKKWTEVQGVIISLFEDNLELKTPEINKRKWIKCLVIYRLYL